ncbi:MAG TPA: ferrochelatase [Marmoricola sp.]|nr:ferrochelatase [Marmoricola sp.]
MREPFDALLLLSFGGPEKPDDVVPFLRNVTRGRGIPDERLVEVGEHYFGFGGRSPINDQNRALLAAIEKDFADNGIDLPLYWGNRNWDPYLKDTLAQMAADGVRRAAVFVTSAYSSYSGCRQYREDLAGATDLVQGAPGLDRLRAYFNHPGFLAPMVDNTIAAIEELGDEPHVLFVTHSVPTMYNDTSGPDGGAYVSQHESVRGEIMAAVVDRTGKDLQHDLVYCSRSGAPGTPWLEPDINDRLAELAEAGVKAVAVIPIGFVSDHMEVVYDLDTQAAETAADLGVSFARAATCGTDPRFVAMVRDLVLERAAAERGEAVTRAACGSLPAAWDLCLTTCCPNPRAPKPTLGEVSSYA